jgi:hypothetical protein
MNYFGPSRAKARAAANPWSALTPSERQKIHQDKAECKRIVECLSGAGPTLEAAAHRVLIADWYDSLWWQARALLGFLVLLLLVGGTALVYRVATAGSYSAAAKDIYANLGDSTTGVEALAQPFPLVQTPIYRDAGPPSWVT